MSVVGAVVAVVHMEQKGVEVDMNSHQDDHMKRGDKDMVGGWSHVLREEDPPWHSEWTAAAAPSSASSSSASACPPSS